MDWSEAQDLRSKNVISLKSDVQLHRAILNVRCAGRIVRNKARQLPALARFSYDF